MMLNVMLYGRVYGVPVVFPGLLQRNGAPVVKSPIAEVWTQSKGDLQQERDGSDSGVFNGQGKMVDTLQ